MHVIRRLIDKYNQTNMMVRASIWFVLVQLIDKGIAVLTQPIINRILSVEEIGVYGVFSSWQSIFAVLASFNLFGGVLEVYLTKQENDKKKVVLSLLSLSLVISCAVFLVMNCFINTFSHLLGLKKEYIFLMQLMIISETIVQFWIVPKRFEYDYRSYAFLVVGVFFTKSVLSVVLAVTFPTDKLLGRILGLTIPAVIVACILLLLMVKKSDKKGICEYWKAALLFNLPLIPHYLSTILLSSSDRIVIERMLGELEAGFYSVAYSVSSLSLILFSTINSAYSPFSMKAIKDKRYEELAKTTDVVIGISVLFAALFMLLAPEGLQILGGEKYLSSLSIIPVLVMGIFLSVFYFLFSNIEFVYNKTKYIFPITLLGASINIVLNVLLIPIYGYKAAAYTTLIGYLIIAVSHYIVGKKIIGKDIYNIKTIVLFVLGLFVFSCVVPFIYSLWWGVRYVIVALFIGVCIWFYSRNNQLLKR